MALTVSWWMYLLNAFTPVLSIIMLAQLLSEQQKTARSNTAPQSPLASVIANLVTQLIMAALMYALWLAAHWLIFWLLNTLIATKS